MLHINMFSCHWATGTGTGPTPRLWVFWWRATQNGCSLASDGIMLPSRSLRAPPFFNPENYYINCRWVIRKISSVTYELIYSFILISLSMGYNMLQSGDWSSMLVISPQLHPNLQPWVPIHKQHPLLVVSVVHSFAQGNILMNQRRSRKSLYYINISIYLSSYLSI